MKMEIAIGKMQQVIDIPENHDITVLLPNEVEVKLTGTDEVVRAIENPIGAPHLGKIIKPNKKIAIVTSDITRPVPSYKIIPAVLNELYKAGAKNRDITIVFGLGSHRKHTEKEKRCLVGNDIYESVKCEDSTDSGFVHLGKTPRGTPVDICKTVAEADIKICIGNVEYHYFAGYSGGAKAIMPGVSTVDAIQSNHTMMVDSRSCAGNLNTNPVRIDIEDAGKICGIDYIVNVVLDAKKEIIYAAAGDSVKAHRNACKFLDTMYKKEIAEKADIVVVSQGGYPKDINLYQTQKALDNAKHAVKDGGIIVLIGSCLEGLGENVFEKWLLDAGKPQDLIDRIKKEFKLGGHKAAAIAMVLNIADIYLVSELEDSLVEKIFMKPYKTAQNALEMALKIKGERASIIVMPYGGSTLPEIKN